MALGLQCFTFELFHLQNNFCVINLYRAEKMIVNWLMLYKTHKSLILNLWKLEKLSYTMVALMNTGAISLKYITVI